MVPHDYKEKREQDNTLPLIINPDGTYTNTLNSVVSAGDIYNKNIMPLEKHSLPYSLCETEGWPYRFLIAPFDCFDWQDLKTERVTYTYDSGKEKSFYINRSLVDIFRKHTIR